MAQELYPLMSLSNFKVILKEPRRCFKGLSLYLRVSELSILSEKKHVRVEKGVLQQKEQEAGWASSGSNHLDAAENSRNSP